MRRSEINKVSEKRQRRMDESDGWRATLRAQGCCFRGPDCSGPTSVHEIVRRGRLTGSEAMPELCVPVCQHHHDLDTHDVELAERIGIRIPRWAYDADPTGVVTWAGRARLAYWARGRTSEPPWRGDGNRSGPS